MNAGAQAHRRCMSAPITYTHNCLLPDKSDPMTPIDPQATLEAIDEMIDDAAAVITARATSVSARHASTIPQAIEVATASYLRDPDVFPYGLAELLLAEAAIVDVEDLTTWSSQLVRDTLMQRAMARLGEPAHAQPNG